MVFREAAQKTGAYMLLAAVLGLGFVTMLTEDLSSPSGRVVSPASEVVGSNWLIFALGLFIGGLVLGAYVYVTRLEAKREE